MNEEKRFAVDAAYESAINLRLFSALLSMAASTSEEANAAQQRRQIEDMLPWKSRRKESSDLFTSCGLRYVGEVLERFEEHFGAGTENFRAVALALAFAAPFLSPGMFIGRQKENLMRKLEKEAERDVYLQGARYLLCPDAKTRAALLENLSNTHWAKTEEALFVLSLHENRAGGFEVMRPQLLRLWGEERSLSLFDNARILDWFITHYADGINDCRKKDNTLLRTLLKLPRQFVRPETPVFKTLAQFGYSELEIRFANSWLVLRGSSAGRLNPNGIPGEKTAAAFCVSLLNSRDAPPDGLFDYATVLFGQYKHFDVKYEGNQGIWNAVRCELHPENPGTLLWMEKNIENNPPFPFDVFSDDWGILAQELPAERYTFLFTEQLTGQETLSKEDVLRWLDRYHDLTGQDFCAQFGWLYNTSHKAFALLVEKDIIDLWDFFSCHKKENSTFRAELDHIRSYAMPVASRQAFEFLQKLADQHPVAQWSGVFGERLRFHDGIFLKSYRYGNTQSIELRLQRDFLSDEELRQLYSWADESIFVTEPENYYKFITCALGDSCIQRIFPKEHLAKVLRALEAAKGISSCTVGSLKELFFTQEELEEDQKAQAAAEEKRNAALRTAELENRKEKLMQDYDGTLKSICAHIRYKSGDSLTDALLLSQTILSERAAQFSSLPFPEQKSFIRLLKTNLETEALPPTKTAGILECALSEVISNPAWPMEAELASNFLLLCGESVRHDAIPRDRIYSLIARFMEEEKQNAAND